MTTPYNRATFFLGDGKYGWSENLWDPVQAAPLTDTLNKAMALAPVRNAMLATGPFIQYIRLSIEGVPRSSLFVALNKNAKIAAWNGQQIKSLTGNIQLPADNPFSSVKVMLSAAIGTPASNFLSKRSISGVPDSLILDQDLDAGDPWFPAWQKYLGRLIANWGIKTYKRHTPNANNNITTIIQDAGGQPTITVKAPLLLVLTSVCTINIRIVGYVADSGTPNLNGLYRAKIIGDPANGVYQLLHPFKPLVPLCNGMAFLDDIVVPPITAGAVMGPGKKSRGRPFGLSRGRSRRR